MNSPSIPTSAPSSARKEIGNQWRLAVPIALTFLLNMGMSITDTVMVAGFGVHALTGIALASDSFSIVFYLASGIIAGLAPFFAKAIAHDEHQSIAQLWRTGVLIVICISLLLIPALWFVSMLFETIGVDTISAHIGAQYQHIIMFALFPMLMVALCRTYLTALQNTRVILMVTLLALPLNAVLNYFFMHGIAGYGALGAVGTGYSTLLVSTLTAVILLFAVWSHSPQVFAKTPTPSYGLNRVMAVLKTGVPIGIGSLAEVGLYLLSTVYVASVGTVDAVAHILVLRLAGVAYAIPAALSQTATVRVAASTTSSAERIAVQAAFRLALFAIVLVCGALLVLAPGVSRLLLDGSPAGVQAAQLAVTLIILLVVMEVFEIPGLTATGILRAHHDTRRPMIYLLFCYWIVSAPLALYLVEIKSLGAIGIWLALLFGMALSSVLIVIRFARQWYAINSMKDMIRGLNGVGVLARFLRV